MMKNSTGKGELVRDQISIVLISGGCAAAVSLCGLLALRLQTGRAVAARLFTVIIATVLAMAAGALGTMQAMLLTQHDCTVVLVVCVAVAMCAVSLGVPLARSVTADSKSLGDAVRALGNDMPGPGVALATAELEELRRLLAGTSARLAESRRREHALARSRRELVAWVSHDLRTPLADLRAMAEMPHDDVNADLRHHHTRMRTSVEQLSAMVEDLAEMSGAHAGALRLSLTSVPLADLVSQAMLTASRLAQEHGVALSSAAPTPIAVRVDSRELSRALEDLLATAIRHTPRRGSVRVEAMERDGRAILAVTHTSDRKPECATGHVWEPRIGGGRGLTIVRGIVEAHSGEITVHDTIDGSRFELRLPMPAGQGRYAHASAG